MLKNAGSNHQFNKSNQFNIPKVSRLSFLVPLAFFFFGGGNGEAKTLVSVAIKMAISLSAYYSYSILSRCTEKAVQVVRIMSETRMRKIHNNLGILRKIVSYQKKRKKLQSTFGINS